MERNFQCWNNSHHMKKKSFIIFSILGSLNSSAQQGKLILQPDSICGKDALVWNAPGYNNGNTNYGTMDAIGSHAWTNNGTPDTARSLLQFDMSAIPPGAVINYAYLSLFNNPTTAYAQGQHSTLSGGNDLYIQRITSPWDENTVIWFTQPPGTTQNQVIVPSSTSANQDYPGINVTNLVQDMVDNPFSSFGFMIRLQDETFYRAMVFGSSDCADATKRPMLAIQYTLPASACFTLQPHEGCGKDALVWNAPGFANGTTNYGSDGAMGAHAWTNNGTPDTARTLLDFDLTVIPANAVITSASLSLYNNPTTSYAGGAHSWLSGPNNGLLQRITSYWDEKTVTWMTQPTSTIVNQVSIPASTNIHQDYLNIDVTTLVSDMYINPLNSFGFMIRLEDEQFYRALVFASCNYPVMAKNPKLEFCYSIPDGIADLSESPFSIYPNPAHDGFYVGLKNVQSNVTVEVYNVVGEKISEEVDYVNSISSKDISIKNIPPGIYFVRISDALSTMTGKVLVE